MKKLVIWRFILPLIFAAIATILAYGIVCFDQRWSNGKNDIYKLSLFIAIAIISVIYFFVGKKYNDVNVKKLFLIFSIWTAVISSVSFLTKNSTILLLSGIHYYYFGAILEIFPASTPIIILISGFISEMLVLTTGIVYGRLSKPEKKYTFTFYKISSLLLWILSMLFFYSITLIFLKIPYTVLKQNIALESGRIISGTLCCLWYFFAGIKTSKGNLLKTLSAISLWNVLAVILRFVTTSFIPLYLSGGYISLLSAVSVFTNSKAIIYLSAFAVELALISSGVLFGRHLDKKKAPSFKNDEEKWMLTREHRKG